MSSSNDSDDMIVGINVTPLVDVVLVLLVIFMLAAPVIYQAAIKVDLPKAVSGENAEHITLRFTATKDGSTMLDKEKVSDERIAQIIKESLEKDPTTSAVVAADKECSHGQVIALIDVLKTNGISKIALGVDSSATKGKGNQQDKTK